MLFYRFSVIFAFAFSTLTVSSQSIIVQPYLQNASSHSITIMWEASSCDPGLVNWGTSNSLGNISSATSLNSHGGDCIYTSKLTGLQPTTKYYYRLLVV